MRSVANLHRQIGRCKGPIPVVEVARALDIEEVRLEHLDGCEGVLLTDRVRSRGRILVNRRGGQRRVRFGIGHELGHFLNERHLLHGARNARQTASRSCCLRPATRWRDC